jgi:hypothetical protein
MRMEIKPPHFYHERRQKIKKKRKRKFLKKTTVFSVVILTILIIYFITANPVNPIHKISASKKEDIPQKNIKKTRKDVLIAYNGKIGIYLPFNRHDFIAIGFHSAYNEHAFEFLPIGKEVDTEKMPRKKALSILRNTKHLSYLKMSRSSRNGRPCTAIDIGAKAGSVVRSPINGTVAFVRQYLLYGRVNDYEIHIFPKGYKDRHLIIIHVTNPIVKTGDVVKRGETPIARVRKISDLINPQLHEFTKESGNHIHIQINKLGKHGESTIQDYK